MLRLWVPGVDRLKVIVHRVSAAVLTTGPSRESRQPGEAPRPGQARLREAVHQANSRLLHSVPMFRVAAPFFWFWFFPRPGGGES